MIPASVRLPAGVSTECETRKALKQYAGLYGSRNNNIVHYISLLLLRLVLTYKKKKKNIGHYSLLYIGHYSLLYFIITTYLLLLPHKLIKTRRRRTFIVLFYYYTYSATTHCTSSRITVCIGDLRVRQGYFFQVVVPEEFLLSY